LSATTSFLGRYWRVILFILAIFGLFWLVWSLLNVLLPFIIGLILSYLLLPVIHWIERHLPGKRRLKQTKRILLIILIYLLVIAAIGLILYFTVPLIANSVSQFIADLPTLIPQIQSSFQRFLDSIRSQLPASIQDQINSYINNIGSTITGAFSSGLGAAVSYLSSTFGLILGFASLPVFLFFLLKDAEKLTDGFYSSFPPWLREHTRGVVNIMSDVLGRYIRASIVLGLAVGILDFIGLYALGISFAPALAFWAGLTELIPVLGPWLGAIPGVIVALATDSSKAIWVGVVYFAVQQVEGNILVPRIHSQYLNLHPAIILILLVLGGHFAGLWGIILIVPLTAVFVQLFRFINRTIREENLKRE
jgi:predicted PurR-regulated permease PerM